MASQDSPAPTLRTCRGNARGGSMRTTSEAPVAEPQSVERAASPATGAGDPLNVGGTSPGPGIGVEIDDVAHGFGQLRVIERLDLRVEPGEVLGMVGPSGCGKSTLLELIGGPRGPPGRSDPGEGGGGAG